MRAQPDSIEKLPAFLDGYFRIAAKHLHLRQRQVAYDGEVREQLEMLEHHADAGAQLWLRVADGDPVHRDAAFLERFKTVDAFDQGRFSRSRWAAHHDHLALGNFGRAILQHLDLAVPFTDIADRDHGCSANDGDAVLQATHAV